MDPPVSVLLPYRQAADTIEHAIASLLDQRGPALEVIAVDDGSEDDGPARVARIAAADPRVRPIATGGCGLIGALVRGLAETRGGFIARMDGDDVSLPDRFALQVARLREDESVGACGAQVEAFPREAVGEGMARYVAWQNGLITPEDHARELFIEAPLCHPSVMLRRAALDDAGGWRDNGGPEDYDLWLRLDARGWKLAKVPRVLLRWRHREGRATFADPRYARERFTEAKAPHLARRVRAMGRPLVIWGAGRTGKRLARAMEADGLRPEWFVDIDANKIGGVARGRPIVAADALCRGAHTVVVAVGALGAREEIRDHLRGVAFVEGVDYVCAA
jgi:glycosyltransferase involved in cell wall biosynthesis